MVIANAETRSFKLAAIVLKGVVGPSCSTNTIERVTLEVGNDVEAAAKTGWQDVLTGEVPTPAVAIVEFDRVRIRTRQMGCPPANPRETSSKFSSIGSATNRINCEPDRRAIW